MRGFLALKNQACPWNGATENVRPDHGTECPPFQMRPMKSFVQENPMAGLTETISQFDILDASWKVLLIKTVNLIEGRAADRAASGPERRSIRVTFLMHEVVKQVPILGNHALDSGLDVVGAKNGVDIRTVFEHFYNTVYRARHYNNVRVDKENDVSPRVTDSVIARSGRS